MAHIEDDFAAYTTIGERVAPVSTSTAKPSSLTQGPKFGVPAKLEPFTLLAKSARGAGAANLISQAVSAPGVYVFSELLNVPSIQQLSTNDQHAGQYKLLELFAYGTWSDYDGNRDGYPTLTPEQETKLKQLTILSLAFETRIIPYSTLLSSIDMSSIPALEDLLIESIYSNIFTARLDQKHSRIEILSSLGRDVRPVASSSTIEASNEMQLDAEQASSSSSGGGSPSISTLLSSLNAWQSRIDGLLNSLDQHVAQLLASSVNDTKLSVRHESKVREIVNEVGISGKGGKKGGAGNANRIDRDVGGWTSGQMDVDLPTMGTAAGTGGFGGGGGDRGTTGTTRSAMSPGGGSGGGGGMRERTRKRGRI